MSVDFDALVLAPCEEVFSHPVTITPVVSDPNASPYEARGIWTIKVTDILTEDGGSFSNRKITLGIQLSEFEIVPKEGDWVSTPVSHLPLAYWQGDVLPNSVIDFVIDDATPDGQGHSVLTLKRQHQP